MRLPVPDSSSFKQIGLPDPQLSHKDFSGAFGASMAQAGAQGAANMRQAGEGLSKLGSKAVTVAEKLQHELDQSSAQEAAMGSSRYLIQRLNMDPDAYLTRKGANAIDAGTQFGAEMDKHLSKTREVLTPKAQEMYDRIMVPKLLSHLEQLSVHETTERRNYNNEAFKGLISTDIDALGMATTPKVEEVYRKAIKDRIAAFKPGELPPEQRAAMVKDAFTKGYTTLIGKLIETDRLQEATAILNRVEPEIDPDVALKLRKAVDANGLTAKMRDFYQNSKLAGETWQQVEAKLLAGKGPFKGKEIEQMITFGRQEENYKHTQTQQQRSVSLMGDRDFIWNPKVTKADVDKYINNIPPGEGDRLKHAQIEARERFNLDGTGHSKTTNDFVYLSLLKAIDNGAGNVSDILTAYESGQLSSSDKTQLLKHTYTYGQTQDTARLNKTWDIIENRIKDKYDGNTIRQQEALSYLKRSAFDKQIKDPDQLMNYVEQELKKDWFGADPYWKIHAKAEYQDAQKHGELIQWLGKENLSHIAASLVDPSNPNRKDKWTYEDIWKFMRQVGLDKQDPVVLPNGEKIPSNKRAWNAISSLLSSVDSKGNRPLITAENITRVLEKYPDGIIPRR